MTFEQEVSALYVQYGRDIKKLREESTLDMFTYILRKPYSNQIRITNIKKMQVGKFYIIRYNFNGNKLWCPILTIPPVPNKNENGILEKQLKLINNKNILFAINFDYLPIKYKTALIDVILKANADRYDKNKIFIESGKNTNVELPYKLNWIYTFLKTNGRKNYCITAYDITKIDKIFDISSTILHRFVFLDTYYINKRIMYETLKKLQDREIRDDFTKKIKIYEEILKLYETDIEVFYKSLRNFEKNLKLIEEL
jgi:hypothetical protein